MKTRRSFILIILMSTAALVAQEVPHSPLLDSWESYQAMKQVSRYHMDFTLLGPVVNSARVEAIQGDPDHPGTFYVAFGSGNLWKTTNHGLSWSPIFEDQPAIGIGDIALAPSNPDILYLGSGESLKKPRNFTMPGVGVFRSDDAGQTWKHLGLPDSYHIGEIAVHPSNPDIAFVAVMGHFWSPNPNRGLYRTLNGGKTWDHVLYLNEHTGANDVVIAHSDPDKVYVSMWHNYPDVAGPNSSVYASHDGGDSWSKATDGFPSNDFMGRTGLAVSFQNPNKVYALVDNRDPNVKQAAQVYRSMDGGQTWSRTHEDDLQILARLGWYFADCYVNPQNDDEFYALGVRLAHSTDGGKTFTMVGGDIHHHNPSPAVPLHLDHCEMWINPLNPKQLALGNDGGLYMTYDKGLSWRHYNNLPAGEFYDIAVDNQEPYKVYGGTQDNSTVFGPSTEWSPLYPDGWEYVWIDAWSGGDGCVTYPDPDDPNTIYTSSQNGGIFRKDMRNDRSKHIRPRLPKSAKGKLQYNFIAPYIISPHNSSTLYHAGNYVFKSSNKGDQWKLISPNLALSEHPEKASTAAGAIAESPHQAGWLFVGTDRGAFWISKNDGNNWTERSSGLPNGYIRSIVPSKYDENVLYVTLNGMNYDDLSCHVYKSDDQGKTWNSIQNNLPDETMNCILEDPNRPGWLYLGGYRGVYVSFNHGANWSLLSTRVAATCISDLVYQSSSQDLVIGTHGRGIYKLNLTPLYSLDNAGQFDGSKLFEIPNGRAPYNNDTHRDVNPESIKKTTFAFWLNESEEVRLRILKQGKKMKDLKISGLAGLNTLTWDLMIEKIENQSPYFIHFKRYLSAGNYRVQLVGRDFTSEQEWEVLPAVFPYK